MVSHPELGSDPPIGSDWESRCDTPRASRHYAACAAVLPGALHDSAPVFLPPGSH